ncbi:hypothetical protein FA15DRAFT_679580 [Coprinopsis marcescibilis]|uniref:SHSP domain-containing protein n=1 Tax=Coprinopsis marcescibilis TaxID=230819 RepID=A0A5C3L2U2_COPMA|nr:hypothetical protein FA15DRAFT_679580 [Coprinopsis marcescibilis]
MPDSFRKTSSSSSATTANDSSSSTSSSPRTPSARFKRHASFSSTPREIPLPSPSMFARERDSYFTSDDVVQQRQELESSAGASTATSSASAALVDATTSPSLSATSPQYARTPSNSSCSRLWRDRLSTTSLPAYPHIPFYALPPAGTEKKHMDSSQEKQRDSYCPPIDESSSESSNVSSSSSSTSSFGSTSSCSSAASSAFHSLDDNAKPNVLSRLPTAMRTRSSVAVASPSILPPPEPPTILENEPAPSQYPGRVPAPYEFFLNTSGPQPADSWLEIETLHDEYRLFARLPGFSREGITLSTKRRRILHLVADKWENGGGHFEKRISFGYDADLVQVRAEFDGEMLRISIPRRQPTWSSSRIAYSGRA